MHKAGALRQKRIVVISSSIILLTLLLSLIMFVVKPTSAQAADISSQYGWNTVKIGGGGFVTGMVIHPTDKNTVYARTDVGGAFRWDERTKTWSQMLFSYNMPGARHGETNVESIAVSKRNSKVVYVAVGDNLDQHTGRILKSTDRGKTWTDSGYRWNIAGNADYRTAGERLVVDPNNDNVLYFGTRKDGLWVSTNGAQNWSRISPEQVPLGSSPAGVKWVLLDPTSGTIQENGVRGGKTKRVYAGVAGQGVYMSENAGKTWERIYATEQIPMDAEVAIDGTLYFSSIHGTNTLHKFHPVNKTLTNISPASDVESIAVDPFNPQRLYVGAGGQRDGHFWRSTNGGATWDTLNVAMASSDIPWITKTDEDLWMSTGAILFDPFVRDRIWFAQGTGVWRTTDINDDEVTWDFISKGIEEMVPSDIIAPPGGKPVTALWDRNGFYHEDLNAYPEKPILTEKFSTGLSLDYSGGTPSFIVGLTTDHRNIHPDHSGYSTDGGKTWTQFSGSRNYPDLFAGNIAVSATDTNNILWQPTNNKPPYVSTDRGATWTKLSFFDNVSPIHTMIWWTFKKAMDSDKVDGGAFYIYSTANGGEFYRSSNNGQSWEKAPGVAPASTANDSHVFGQVRAVPGMAGHVWMSTAQGGLHFTENKGDTWTKANGVQEARAFGFGKTMPGASYPTVFMYGKVHDQLGIWRSTDKGTSWDKVAENPAGYFDFVRVVNGDMNVAGRVYVGLGGQSFIYGDDKNAGTPVAMPTSTPTQAATPTPAVTPTPDTAVKVAPTDDRDDWSEHAGSSPWINASLHQTAYLKFNLSAVSTPVGTAKLRIYRSSEIQGPLTLTAHEVADDTWVEVNTTLPATGAEIAHVSSATTGYVEIDITSFVQAQQSADGVVSIGLKTDKGGWQSFNSKENEANPPELVVTPAA